VAERCGDDAWTVEAPNGASVRRAVDWFIPYLTGSQEWGWKQIKPFDDASMIGLLAACAARFPEERYRLASRCLFDLPEDRREWLLYAAPSDVGR